MTVLNSTRQPRSAQDRTAKNKIRRDDTRQHDSTGISKTAQVTKNTTGQHKRQHNTAQNMIAKKIG